jgi:hypothetical protein
MSEKKVVITLDDVSRVRDEPRPASAPITPSGASGSRDWGTVHGASAPVTSAVSGGSFLYNAWVYLSLAGLAGTFAAWALFEPFYSDESPSQWAGYILITAVIGLMCLMFAVAEALVERNPRKAAIRGAIALLAVLLLMPPCNFASNYIYNVLLRAIPNDGGYSPTNPLSWLARGVAWAIFGAAGGLIYGVAGMSLRQGLYGAIGGIVGALVGGLAFNPISMACGGAELSRGLGFSVFGAATGLAIGLVENALKNRWLYVAQGPLAGKQFILYKPVTVFGNDRACDIYLFKDPTILPQHAAIQVQGAQAMLTAAGPTTINGRPVISPNVRLRSGDQVQIGRYVFRYEETNKVA